MNNISCNDILGPLQADFGKLWRCIKRGRTLEIITPYLYPDKSFVSVFITVRKNRLIVSEGGEVAEFIGATIDDDDFQLRVLNEFAETYRVQNYSTGNRSFYFKDTASSNLIPSLIFDVCNFATAAANAAMVAMPEDDSLELKTFKAQADRYIKRMPVVKGKVVRFSQRLEEIKEATFSAVIRTSSKLWLVSYLTGSAPNYFERSISQSIVNIEFAQDSKIQRQIAAIVPLVNNKAAGYQPKKFQHRLGKLVAVAGSPIVNWTERASIKDYITNGA